MNKTDAKMTRKDHKKYKNGSYISLMAQDRITKLVRDNIPQGRRSRADPRTYAGTLNPTCGRPRKRKEEENMIICEHGLTVPIRNVLSLIIGITPNKSSSYPNSLCWTVGTTPIH